MATIAVAATSLRVTRPRNCSTSSSSSSCSSTSSLSVFASSASLSQSRSSLAASRSRKRASWLSILSEKPNWKDTALQSVDVFDKGNVDNEALVPESPPSSPLPLNFGIRNSIDTDQESENDRRQGPLPAPLGSRTSLRKTVDDSNAKSPSHSTSTTTRGTAPRPTGLKGQSRNYTVMETRPRFSVSTVVQQRPRTQSLGPPVPVSPSLCPLAVSSSRIVSTRTHSPSTLARTTHTFSTSTAKESCMNPKVRSNPAIISPDVSPSAKPLASSGNKFSKSRVTTTTTTTTRVASKTVTTAVRTEKNSSRKALPTPITTTAKITTTTTGSKAKDFGTRKRSVTGTTAAGYQSGVMSTKAGSLVTKEIATTLKPSLTSTEAQDSKHSGVSPSSLLSALKITPTMAVDRARSDASGDSTVGDTASIPDPSLTSIAGTSSLQMASSLLLPALEVGGLSSESSAKGVDYVYVTDVHPQKKTESPRPGNGRNDADSSPKMHRQVISMSQGQTPLASPPPCVQPSLPRVDRHNDSFSQDGVALALPPSFKRTTKFSARSSEISVVARAKGDPAVVVKSFRDDGIYTLVDNLGIQDLIGTPRTKSCIDQTSHRRQETRQSDRISIGTIMGLRPTESPLLRVRDPSAMNSLLKAMKDHREASGVGLTKTPLAISGNQKDTLSARPTPPVVHTFLSRRSRAKVAAELLTPPSPVSASQHQHHTPDSPAPITFATKQAYVRIQAQKRQATSVATPSRNLLQCWTTDPLKFSSSSPAVVLASPIAFTASANPLLETGSSSMLLSQRQPPSPILIRSLSAPLKSSSSSGLSPRLIRPTLTMTGLSAFSSPRTSPGIKDPMLMAAAITTPPRLKTQRSTTFLDTRTFTSDRGSSAPSPQEATPGVEPGDPHRTFSSFNGERALWSTCQPLPATRIVVSQPPTRPGHLPESPAPVPSIFSTARIGPEHDITLLTRRLSNIQLMDALCPTKGTTTTAADSAITIVHTWMDATWAMQIQQLLIHLSAQADLEAESKSRRPAPRYSADVQGSQLMMTGSSKGLFEQLLSDWVHRMDQLPQSVFRDHPGLKREVDKIRWQHDFPQKKIK